MTLQCGTTPTRQQSKAIVQPRRDLFGRKDLGPRGGEFNRQRNTIQPSADVSNRGRVLFLEAEGWVCCHGAIHEEMHAVILLKHIEITELSWVGQWQGWQRGRLFRQ